MNSPNVHSYSGLSVANKTHFFRDAELFHNAVVRKTAVLQTLARPSGWATAGRATVAPGPGHAPMQIAEQFRQTAAFRGWTSLVWVNIIN
jgi:hypothetical protein